MIADVPKARQQRPVTPKATLRFITGTSLSSCAEFSQFDNLPAVPIPLKLCAVTSIAGAGVTIGAHNASVVRNPYPSCQQYSGEALADPLARGTRHIVCVRCIESLDTLYLADNIGWRWVFYIQFPLAVISAFSVYFFLRLPPPSAASASDSDFKHKLKRIDFMGTSTLIIAVFSLLLSLDRGGNTGWNDKLTISLLLGFAIFALGFGLIESRYAAEPIAPPRIAVNRSLLASYFVNLFGIAGAFAQLFHISLYLQAVLGKTASETGAWLVIAVVFALTGSLSRGLIMQATGKYYTLTCVAYVVLLAGTISVLTGTGFMGLPRSTPQVIAGLALTVLGNGSGITTSLISLIANAGRADQAIATAVSYLFRSLGSVVGLSIGSTIVQSTLRSVLHRTLHGKDTDEIAQKVRESLEYLKTLDPETQLIVRSAYGDAVHNVLIFSVSMAVAAMVSSWFIIEKPLSRSSYNWHGSQHSPTTSASLHFKMQFKSLVVLASAVATAWGATVADVLTDLGNVKTQVTTLDNAINGFPNSGGTLTQALAIHTDATNTNSAVQATTSDANTVPTPVSESDGQSILTAIQGIEPIIEDALTAIVAKKAAFQALPVGGIPALVASDLSTLNASTNALENVLIAKAPADLQATAQAISGRINSAFATAIAAYAS
ncbi:hypothetical protein NP233_g456 [Leucocoprinus birnbaumii]|uniref:Major facilitator superfamily (MFS) profile domain-containing protein n=1 Tax=Leucocoprinus birnbaumii TaxID=56174 RepID=A0AAD5W2S7_9AGAR|nr:hypothetical protein NP233_g456 [Leucocoprinus birnbaumii]